MAIVSIKENEFYIDFDSWDLPKIKLIPDSRIDKNNGVCRVPFTAANAVMILAKFHSKEISNAAHSQIKKIQDLADNAAENKFPSWYKFKVPPFDKQMMALNKAWSRKEFAFFMEMRTGKTFTSINLACARALEGSINAMLVFCPTPVKTVWKWEIEKYATVDTDVFILESGSKGFDDFICSPRSGKMKVLIVGIEAMSMGGASKLVSRFAMSHATMAIVDESSKIKNDDSVRTSRIIDAGGLCKYRLILTGTEVTQGIEDLYSQFKFLNWKIVGHKSFFTFRNRYCIMGGFEGRKVIGYDNMHELMDLMRHYCVVIKAEEMIDLPEKIYETRLLEPSKQQKEALRSLRDTFFAESKGMQLETKTSLDRMTRYMQIIGGNFPYQDPVTGENKIIAIEGRNPKLDELMNVVDEITGKIIIWANFRLEIDLICETLRDKFGHESVAEFHGGTSTDMREFALKDFQSITGSSRFFITNKTGAMGIELSAASTHIIYSNGFSLENRLQSEARTNSVNQKSKSILYVDLMMNHIVDKMTYAAIVKKGSIAKYVKENLKEIVKEIGVGVEDVQM